MFYHANILIILIDLLKICFVFLQLLDTRFLVSGSNKLKFYSFAYLRDSNTIKNLLVKCVKSKYKNSKNGGL